jgi:hypothetical protein
MVIDLFVPSQVIWEVPSIENPASEVFGLIINPVTYSFVSTIVIE